VEFLKRSCLQEQLKQAGKVKGVYL